MHRKRMRADIVAWAEHSLTHVQKWAASARTGRQNAFSGSDVFEDAEEEGASKRDAETHHAKTHHAKTNDAQGPYQEIVDRLIQRVLERDEADVERIAQWVEAHGEDAWLAFMAKWELLSRQMVDELMRDRHERTRQKSKKSSPIVHRWERAARAISEGVVHLMMDTTDVGKRRNKRGTAARTYTKPRSPVTDVDHAGNDDHASNVDHAGNVDQASNVDHAGNVDQASNVDHSGNVDQAANADDKSF